MNIRRTELPYFSKKPRSLAIHSGAVLPASLAVLKLIVSAAANRGEIKKSHKPITTLVRIKFSIRCPYIARAGASQRRRSCSLVSHTFLIERNFFAGGFYGWPISQCTCALVSRSARHSCDGARTAQSVSWRVEQTFGPARFE